MAKHFFALIIITLSHYEWMHSTTGCQLLYDGIVDANVYYGWPFSIECTQAVHYYYDDDKFPQSMMIDIYKEKKPLECLIQDLQSGDILLNSTLNVSMREVENEISGYRYHIANITDELSSKYRITLTKDGLCWKANVTLHQLKLPHESCDENLRLSKTIDARVYVNSVMSFPCEVPSDILDQPRSLIRNDEIDDANAQVIWLHNCNKALPKNTHISPSNYLQIRGVDYSRDLGVFTCAIYYNGMIRYRVHHRTCASPPTSQTLTAVCDSRIARISSNASIECTIDTGLSGGLSYGFRGFFYKKPKRGEDNIVKRDEFYCESIEEKKQNQRITCNLRQSQNPTHKCYWEALTDGELGAHITKFTFVYDINDVRESDFGEFALVFMNADNANVTTTFTLQADTEHYFIQTQRFFIIALAVLVGIIFGFLILRRCFGIEVRWIWRNFCKPYERDCKTYLGYLTYYFSDDMTETVPSQLKSFVNCLNCHLRRKGGEMFDGYKDMSPYLRTNNISDESTTSSSVIVVHGNFDRYHGKYEK